MKHLVPIFGLLMLLPLFGYTQSRFPGGLILNDEEYDQLPHTSENIQIDHGQKAVSRKIDLSPYCPEVRHQGDISSCVGWSAGYAAMTIEKAIQNGWSDKRLISENAHSALFIYNQISAGNCDLGITMPKALTLLQEKGNCLARDFDFNINDCSKKVPLPLFEKARQYRIEDYIPLFKKEADSEEKIRNVKLVLAQKKPVIIGMKILYNFYQIKAGESRWFPEIGDTNYAGGHAMVVVGYDDDRFYRPGMNIPEDKQGAFKLMNSWGKNWGERGFIWVTYEHFAEYCQHAYAIMLANEAPIDFDIDMTPEEMAETAGPTESVSLTSISGSFGFRQFTGKWNGRTPIFKEAGVRLTDGSYMLKGDSKTGDAFQLYVESGFENGYIYVFSVDPIGKAEIHFPKSEEYNVAFQGQNESAILLSSGSLLTIPAKDAALQLSHPGTDYLVALFSTQKIRPKFLRYLCNELSNQKENLKNRLLELLGPFMVPPADITYQKDRMGFEVSTRNNGKIVPVLLTVRVSPK